MLKIHIIENTSPNNYAYLLLLCICACTVGPDYTAPKSDLPDQWRSNKRDGDQPHPQITKTNTPVKEIQWWQHFNDPTLTILINEINDQNLDLQKAIAQIKSARALLRVSESTSTPNLTLNSYVSEEHFPPAVMFGSNNQYHRTLAGLQFDAQWELDIFGGAKRAKQAALAQLQAAYAQTAAIFVMTAAELATNYFLLRLYQRQAHIIEQIIDTAKQIVLLKEDLFKAGIIPELELISARSNLHRANVQRPKMDTQIKTTLHQIAILLGKQPTCYYSLLDCKEPTMPQVPIHVFTNLPASLISQRPDIIVAERELAASNAEIGVAIAEMLPKFSLTGGFGYIGARAKNVLQRSSQAWSLGTNIFFNVFDMGRLHAEVENQKALNDLAGANYKSTVLNALREVEDALVAWANLQSEHYQIKKIYDNSNQAYVLTQDLNKTGNSSNVDVLEAKINMLNSEIDYLSSQANCAIANVSLYKAFGGGWAHVAVKTPASNT